jgi:MoaA/NifB/PqqE/SkfB family radical SAM enzyme
MPRVEQRPFLEGGMLYASDRLLRIPLQIDLIWNHTYVCTQDCADCCVAAVHVQREGSQVRLRDFLSMDTRIEARDGESKYQTAQRHLQGAGRELTFDAKLKVLDHLEGFDCRVDFSGGDALVTPEGIELLEKLSARLGRENVTLTITGAGLERASIARVAAVISELNFTFNAATPGDAFTRPTNYAAMNLQLARRFQALGVHVRAECPLTNVTAAPEHLERLYRTLASADIDSLLVMRQFNVGRGSVRPEVIPTREEYLAAISTLRKLEAGGNGPKVKLQCALRHLEGTPPGAPNPCDLGVRSYGLMPDGTLLASPWAYGNRGNPLGETWVMGNLASTPLQEILKSPKAQEIMRRADENLGACKIHAALASRRQNPLDRLFDFTDPLYAASEVTGEAA